VPLWLRGGEHARDPKAGAALLRRPTSKTLPRGEAPNPRMETWRPVLPRRRLGTAAVIATQRLASRR
jgi:hypothetical protein